METDDISTREWERELREILTASRAPSASLILAALAE